MLFINMWVCNVMCVSLCLVHIGFVERVSMHSIVFRNVNAEGLWDEGQSESSAFASHPEHS